MGGGYREENKNPLKLRLKANRMVLIFTRLEEKNVTPLPPAGGDYLSRETQRTISTLQVLF